MNILQQFNRPVLGLSPMDGVTDLPYRVITKKYGDPDLTFTEFVNVQGLLRGAEKLFVDLLYTDIERPVVAQLFGKEPESFYLASQIVCELGFDGVDINMGCPAKSVAGRGAGAGLIQYPDLAKQIIASAQAGVKDWYDSGLSSEIPDKVVDLISHKVETRKQLDRQLGVDFERFPGGKIGEPISVSVKTRIGYASNQVDSWIPTLAECEPDWIAVHGRTYKQMYQGSADWEALARCTHLSSVPVLVNGDVKNKADVSDILKQTEADGVLIGRGSYGNPWVFSGQPKPDLPQICKVMLEHARLHSQIKGERAFVQMRKHLAWYISGFPNAVSIRKRLVQVSSVQQLEDVLSVVC